MKNDDLIARLLRRHPHFTEWVTGFARGDAELTALQFAVVDAHRSRADLADLYARLQSEVAIRVFRDGRSFRIPTMREFARVARLHLAMVCDIPWRMMERRARGGGGPPGLSDHII